MSRAHVRCGWLWLCVQVYEPILVLGKERFEGVDIRIRCKGACCTANPPSLSRRF